MPFMSIVSAVAPSVIGGLLGGSGGANSSTQSTQAQIDPRIAAYIYGADNKGGLLGSVNSLFQQQMGQNGLNPMQTAGLELQRQTLMSPAYTQGFNQMRQLGAGLLGQGVAGNPFTSSQTAMAPNMLGSLGLGGGIPQAALQPIQQAAAPAAQPAPAAALPPPKNTQPVWRTGPNGWGMYPGD